MRSRIAQARDRVLEEALEFGRAEIKGREWARPDTLVEAVRDHDVIELSLDNQKGRAVTGSADTSHEAARLILPKLKSVRLQILHAIMSRPDGMMTDEALERELRMKHQTVSSARNSLVESGWLEDSAQRMMKPNGRRAALWRLTPAGRVKMLHAQSEGLDSREDAGGR